MGEIEVLETDNDPGTETLETISKMRSYALIKYKGKELLVPYFWEGGYAEDYGDYQPKFGKIDDDILDENDECVKLTDEELKEIAEEIEVAF